MHPVGFEPTHLSIAVLETAPLDHSGTNASLCYIPCVDPMPSPPLSCSFPFLFPFLFPLLTLSLTDLEIKMHPVGFEPTHLSIAELKSAPLDHSGTNASYPYVSPFYPLILLSFPPLSLLPHPSFISPQKLEWR